MARRWFVLGALLGFLAVCMGAFGAHGLKKLPDVTPERLAWWQTGSSYAMYHALALLAAGAVALRSTSRACAVSGWAFLAGSLVFSGTLWLMTVTGVRWLGAITPLGGLALLVGWAALAKAAWSLPATKESP